MKMRRQLFFGLTVFLLLVLLPLVSLGGRREREEAPAQAAKTTRPPDTKQSGGAGKGETIEVLRTATGETETIGLEEYLIGCVAAEMPAASHEEALKAQAVAAYTYARYRLEVTGRDALHDTGARDQGYLSREQRQAKWGGSCEANEAKLTKAVKAVAGQCVTYEGKPIFAAYHAISGGQTESAKTYWGKDYPYLQSVISTGDKLSPGYEQSVTFTPDEIKAALKGVKGVSLKGEAAKWFGKPKRGDTGIVTEISVGGEKLSGRQLREALALRSANFDITYKDGKFVVKTYGYGHGVGMSQYGADFMARQGDDYKAILEHYYPGATVG